MSIESPGKAARTGIECTAEEDASSGDVSYINSAAASCLQDATAFRQRCVGASTKASVSSWIVMWSRPKRSCRAAWIR
jgi:hypothetical protein